MPTETAEIISKIIYGTMKALYILFFNAVGTIL